MKSDGINSKLVPSAAEHVSADVFGAAVSAALSAAAGFAG